MPRPPGTDGAVNVPAATSVADVTFALRRARDERLSHDPDAAFSTTRAGARRQSVSAMAPVVAARLIMIYLSGFGVALASRSPRMYCIPARKCPTISGRMNV